MKRTLLTSLVSLSLLGTGALVADDPQMGKTETNKTTMAGSTQTPEKDTVVGIVKEYEPGKMLKVAVGKKTRSFSLDAKDIAVDISTNVAVGHKVKVVESKNAEGMKTLTVTPAS